MPPRPRRRRLTGEETALWGHVTAGMRRLHQPRLDETGDDATAAPAEIAPTPAAASPGPGPQPPQPPRLDARRADRLARGRIAPEARIDLHGMTLAEAHPALTGFLSRARGRGLRLVLVITGKGADPDDAAETGPIPAGRGVLRRQVPHWLRQPPLDALIVETRPAHPRHGGAGALYVWLRRPRGTGLQGPRRGR